MIKLILLFNLMVEKKLFYGGKQLSIPILNPTQLYDNFIFLFFYWSKTMKREKGRERIR